MIITKKCFDCEKEFSFPEVEVFDGLVARPIRRDSKQCMKIWLCKKCRKDAVAGGVIAEEDINIVENNEPIY